MSTSNPCSICLVEKISDPANLDGCNHSYCFKCIINWAERTNTVIKNKSELFQCPACKSRFLKITRQKNGKVTEVEEREQGTNYTIEDAENDYGDSASEESEYGAAHPFIDEEAESGEETSEDEVEAQKECNRWAGYLNCEDERFEKRSSEEEDEALSDEDYAHMQNSDYDYDDFVVPDDDVSMLTDASSDSSERGRVKRRRLKRAHRSASSSSSSSEIHISVEEEESIDEDQPRRKRRRIDDDDQPALEPELVDQLKDNAAGHSSPPAEQQVKEETSATDAIMTDEHKAARVTSIDVEAKPDIVPTVAIPVVIAENTTTEVRTKKRKRSKRKGNQDITSSSSVPARQCTPPTAKTEEAINPKEDTMKSIKTEHKSNPQQDNSSALSRHSENKAVLPAANTTATTEGKKKRKKKKKKNKANVNMLQSQSTDGTNSQMSQLIASQSTVASTDGNATQSTLPKKKKKRNKKKKNRALNGTATVPSESMRNVSEVRSELPSNKNVAQSTSVSAKNKKASNKNVAQSASVSAKNKKEDDKPNQSNTNKPHSSNPYAVAELPKASAQDKSKYSDDKRKAKKKKKKKKPSNTGAVNGGTSEVELSIEERKSAEKRYEELKRLIAQM